MQCNTRQIAVLICFLSRVDNVCNWYGSYCLRWVEPAYKYSLTRSRLFNSQAVAFCATCRPRAALEPFVLLLALYAPHIAEELWSRLG
jgi:hypothetical protein